MSEACGCEAYVLDMIDENFTQARGFSLYDLAFTYDPTLEAETLTWDTITPDSDFRAALRYFEALALEYLADGTASHICTHA